MQQQQEPEDDSESGDESDDDAWRNRRKNLKNKADTRIAATASDADADNSVPNAVYGFGGVNGGARAPGANVKAVSASAAAKVITTTVRASDRAVAVAAEEEKSCSRSCDSSPTSSPSQTALSMRSPDSVSSPGVDTTWHDVASPSPAVSPNNTDLPRPPTKIIIEVDEEEPVTPMAPPEKTETSGLLGGASAQRSRKGKKGGKLINVSKK